MSHLEINKSCSEVLRGNHDKTVDTTTPSPNNKKENHYAGTIFNWDTAFIVMVWCELGEVDNAMRDFRSLMRGQYDNGMIPCRRYADGGPPRRYDPEPFLDNERNRGSDYTQPTLLAMAANKIYQTCRKQGDEEKGREFLQESYGNLKKHFNYLLNERVDDDNLYWIMTPSESGTDASPIFDEAKGRGFHAPGNKIEGIINAGRDYALQLWLQYDLKNVEWDPERAKEIFCVKNVADNCYLANDLRYMAEIAEILGNNDDQQMYEEKAGLVEDAVLTKLWDTEEKRFWAINANAGRHRILKKAIVQGLAKRFSNKSGLKQIEKYVDRLFPPSDVEPGKEEFIKKETVSGLIPLILDNLEGEQLEAIVDLLNDEMKFKTKYMVPTVAADSPDYDPHYIEPRIWRGPVWTNKNFIIVVGLLKQLERLKSGQVTVKDPETLERKIVTLSYKIANDSVIMYKAFGAQESYDSTSAQGQRVKDFSWATLVLPLRNIRNGLIAEYGKAYCNGLKMVPNPMPEYAV